MANEQEFTASAVGVVTPPVEETTESTEEQAVMAALKNFSYSLVATAPSPATSGTSLVVTAGQGSYFPTTPFDFNGQAGL